MKFKLIAAVLVALAASFVAPAAAHAAPYGTTSCWYNLTYNEIDSTRIQVTAVPQCAGEPDASMILWLYIPISQGNQYEAGSSGSPAVLTWNCTGGTSPNLFHLQVSGGSPYTFQTYNINDNCGPHVP